MIKNLVCPRCAHFVPSDTMPGQYPGALSRYDNETEICSACGTREALFQYSGYKLPPVDVDLSDMIDRSEWPD